MAVTETQNILKQIYDSSEVLVETSEESSSTLGKIYKLQVKRRREEKADQLKEDRDEQRQRRSQKRKAADVIKKEKVKKEEVERVRHSCVFRFLTHSS